MWENPLKLDFLETQKDEEDLDQLYLNECVIGVTNSLQIYSFSF